MRRASAGFYSILLCQILTKHSSITCSAIKNVKSYIKNDTIENNNNQHEIHSENMTSVRDEGQIICSPNETEVQVQITHSHTWKEKVSYGQRKPFFIRIKPFS